MFRVFSRRFVLLGGASLSAAALSSQFALCDLQRSEKGTMRYRMEDFILGLQDDISRVRAFSFPLILRSLSNSSLHHGHRRFRRLMAMSSRQTSGKERMAEEVDLGFYKTETFLRRRESVFPSYMGLFLLLQ